MHYDLILLMTICILILYWSMSHYHYLRLWVAHFKCQSSIAKRKCKGKSHLYCFPTKRPECPLCQAKEMLSYKTPPEPPPLITYTLGRPRTTDTGIHYCPNNHCEYYDWIARGNICGNGHPNSGKWRQMKCIVCGTYFLETLGTPFYRSKASPETIILALKSLAEGLCIQSTARVFDVDADTVQDWLAQAAKHMDAISRYLIHDLHLTQVQVDELWSLLGERDELSPQKQNTRWIWSAIDPQSKLWLGFLVADRSLESDKSLFIMCISCWLLNVCHCFSLTDGNRMLLLC
jgi:transposase-like protein